MIPCAGKPVKKINHSVAGGEISALIKIKYIAVIVVHVKKEWNIIFQKLFPQTEVSIDKIIKVIGVAIINASHVLPENDGKIISIKA